MTELNHINFKFEKMFFTKYKLHGENLDGRKLISKLLIIQIQAFFIKTTYITYQNTNINIEYRERKVDYMSSHQY